MMKHIADGWCHINKNKKVKKIAFMKEWKEDEKLLPRKILTAIEYA